MTALTDDVKWMEKYPEVGRGPVSVQSNISPDFFRLEREKVFRPSWLYAARVNQLSKPGDYLTRDFAVLGASVLLVRGADGVIRGFRNVCKHRGNTLATASRGNAGQFTCGYHGWTYDLEGRLKFVPDEIQFADFRRPTCDLTPVACETWEGFVFVNLDPRPPQTLHSFLGELGGNVKGFPFGEMSQVGGFSAEVQANWKLLMAIFQEGYHVPTLHNAVLRDAGCGPGNPLCHFIYFKLYERHRFLSAYLNPQHRPSPAEIVAFKYGASLLAAEGQLPAAVNPSRHPHWLFDVNVIFPNMILDLSSMAFWTYHFWPLAVDRTLYEARFYMRPARNAGERIAQEYNKVLLRETLREDLKLHEEIQRNMASGALDQVYLSDQEIAVRHMYKVVEDVVGSSATVVAYG